MKTEPPGLLLTARLVLGLRFRLFARGRSAAQTAGALLGLGLALALAGGLALGCWWLFARAPGVSDSPLWRAFAMALVAFLLGLFWILWPVVATHIDESSELKRFLAFPVRPARLYLVHTLAALAEPAALFFYPALLGMTAGLARPLGPPAAVTAALLPAFSLMNVAAGRMLQNLFLNIMSSRRSAEVVGAAFLLLLGLSVLLPPVDVSWLAARLGGVEQSPRDLALLASTARALAHTPPGWLALGLAAGAAGKLRVAWVAAGLMLAAAAAAWGVGLLLLLRYVRGGRGTRPAGKKAAAGASRVEYVFSGPLMVLAVKEVRQLFANPKARLSFAVPFFLLVLLKILGGVGLARHFLEGFWAAVLWASAGGYALSVFCGNFLANGFGYDEEGVRLLALLPRQPRFWFLGRNLAQAFFALAQFAGLGAVVMSMRGASARALALPVLGYGATLLFCLAAGNLLSVKYPRRFHFDLSRRDRPPAPSVTVIMLVLAASALVQAALLALCAPNLESLWLWGWMPVLAGFFLWSRSLDAAGSALLERREEIISSLALQ